MIRFEVLKPNDLAAAWVTLVRVGAEVDGNFELGPTSDTELIEGREVFVDGDDEVEAAEVLGMRLTEAGVAWRAL